MNKPHTEIFNAWLSRYVEGRDPSTVTFTLGDVQEAFAAGGAENGFAHGMEEAAKLLDEEAHSAKTLARNAGPSMDAARISEYRERVENLASTIRHFAADEEWCGETLRGAAASNSALREVALAAVRYDEAIRSCANEPDKMASFCTAEGATLDDLYADWIGKARAALADGAYPGGPSAEEVEVIKSDVLEFAARLCESKVHVNGCAGRLGGEFPRTAAECAAAIRARKTRGPEAESNKQKG